MDLQGRTDRLIQTIGLGLYVLGCLKGGMSPRDAGAIIVYAVIGDSKFPDEDSMKRRVDRVVVLIEDEFIRSSDPGIAGQLLEQAFVVFGSSTSVTTFVVPFWHVKDTQLGSCSQGRRAVGRSCIR
jgi:hypothetical protein